jgi:hypothetical protein
MPSLNLLPFNLFFGKGKEHRITKVIEVKKLTIDLNKLTDDELNAYLVLKQSEGCMGHHSEEKEVPPPFNV